MHAANNYNNLYHAVEKVRYNKVIGKASNHGYLFIFFFAKKIPPGSGELYSVVPFPDIYVTGDE